MILPAYPGQSGILLCSYVLGLGAFLRSMIPAFARHTPLFSASLSLETESSNPNCILYLRLVAPMSTQGLWVSWVYVRNDGNQVGLIIGAGTRDGWKGISMAKT